MPTPTLASLRQLARSSTRYGYFVVPDRRADDPNVWVACPACKTRVHAWLPCGERGARAGVKALHKAVLAHLRAVPGDCPPAP